MSYLTADHLGSTRVVTDGNQVVKARRDYLPFGEEIESSIGGRASVTGYTSLDSTRQRFTSKERDTESGLDYFLARYYSGSQGRFTSADAPLIGQYEDDPQTWNLFMYARNNPLLYVDPSGTDYVLQDKDGNERTLREWAGNNPDYEYVDGAEDGSWIVVRDKSGVEWYGEHVEGPHFESIKPISEERINEIATGGRKIMRGEVPFMTGGGWFRGGGKSLWQRIKDFFSRGSSSVPTLTGATSREMTREAIQHVKSLPGTAKQKADLFEQLAKQITEKTGGSWKAGRMTGTDGSHVFLGSRAEMLVIKPNGQIFRGTVQGGGASFGAGGTPTPNYNNLRLIE